jgi:hypothetical protein
MPKASELSKYVVSISNIISPAICILSGVYALNVIPADKLPYALFIGAGGVAWAGIRRELQTLEKERQKSYARQERLERLKMETQTELKLNENVSPINQLMPHVIENLPLIISIIAQKKGVDPNLINTLIKSNGIDLDNIDVQSLQPE